MDNGKPGGYTQQDLARLLRISTPQMNRILHGKRRASVDLLFRLSQITTIPMETLAVNLHGRRVA